MANTRSRLIGTRELEKAYAALPIKLKGKPFDDSQRAKGQVVKREAKRLVPVDQGFLKRTISLRKVRGRPVKFDSLFFLGFSKKKFPDATRKSGFDQPSRRAHLTEFGAPQRGVRAQPFMRPAISNSRAAALKAERDALLKSIITIARDLNRPFSKISRSIRRRL